LPSSHISELDLLLRAFNGAARIPATPEQRLRLDGGANASRRRR
jgi:hypothetical protein